MIFDVIYAPIVAYRTCGLFHGTQSKQNEFLSKFYLWHAPFTAVWRISLNMTCVHFDGTKGKQNRFCGSFAPFVARPWWLTVQNEFLQNQPHLWHAFRGRLSRRNFYRTRPICGMQTIRTNSWISYALFVAEVSNDFLRKLCPIFGRSYPLVSQEFMPYCGKSSNFWQKYHRFYTTVTPH